VPGLLCVGADDSSMVRAVSRINEMNGGWVVVGHDEVIAEFPTPVAGVCSAEPIGEALELYDGVKKGLNAIGAEVERPMLAIQTLTFRGVPSLKLSFSGYADILKREIVGLSL
ncbi:MAG: adenine deaminase C-terminal domain-containing protein, partial [Halobacteria archaeon]|nr:adenine deaminase C-terminal domain-containing protein [Halobacteria archaeon]